MGIRSVCVALVLGCALAVQAASPLPDAAASAQQQRIEQSYREAQARCGLLEGHARDVCDQRARGERAIRSAELQVRQQPTAENQRKWRMAKAEADHAAAMMKCKALLGAARTVCREDADAVLAAARQAAGLPNDGSAQVRSGRTFDERSGQAERIAEAQLKAARERCGMQPDAARPVCLADAQRRFGTM